MGNLAATFYGMPEIRFHSGGTAPTAFNPRTVASLKAVGFEVESTGKEAERGEPKTENPIYRISWGESFETLEFSKHYGDKANPQEGFAALMVCSEADEGCPFVKGATLRLSMPYLDPKIYDGGAYESAKYAERRDDIGRLMLSVMVQARGELASNGVGRPLNINPNIGPTPGPRSRSPAGTGRGLEAEEDWPERLIRLVRHPVSRLS